MDQQKILFNCTTNIIGGGVKNSALFIKYAVKSKRFNWNYAISPQVESILKKWDITIDSCFFIFPKSPARNKSARKKLHDLTKELNVTAVFTMAGPAYVKFDVLHIQGLSSAYITHASLSALFLRPDLKSIIRTVFLVLGQAWYAYKADYFIFQTEIARRGFCNRFFIPKEKTSVISNAFDSTIFQKNNFTESVIDLQREIVIFCPAAPFYHKGLQYIPSIAKELSELSPNLLFQFQLTISKNDKLWNRINRQAINLNVENFINTIGPYNYTDAYRLYNSCDVVFIPSLLETFSANYLEAMISKKALIAANKEFAKDICQDAALYINPANAKETASTILQLITNQNLYSKLIDKGLINLKRFNNHEVRFELFEKEIYRRINLNEI